LIEIQLEMLSDEGISPIGMVVGYCESDIREIVGRRVDYIQNSRWANTDSLYSFSLARDWVKDEVIILNCDVLFHPEILDRLISAKGNAIVYDSGGGRGREQMKVKLSEGNLTDMSKTIPTSEANGENVGMLKFDLITAKMLFEEASNLIASGQEKHWLGTAVRLIVHFAEIKAVDIAGLPWGEIDFPIDLEVWPAIQRSTLKRKFHWKTLRWILLLAFLLGISPLVMKGINPESAVNWDTVDLLGGKKVKIYLKEKKQKKWWKIKNNDTLKFEGEGPNKYRIESRMILDKSLDMNIPYLLEIQLDGKRINWLKEKIKPSKIAKYKNITLGKRARSIFEMPAGTHNLGIRLISSKGGRCLVRVRQLVQEEDDEK